MDVLFGFIPMVGGAVLMLWALVALDRRAEREDRERQEPEEDRSTWR